MVFFANSKSSFPYSSFSRGFFSYVRLRPFTEKTGTRGTYTAYLRCQMSRMSAALCGGREKGKGKRFETSRMRIPSYRRLPCPESRVGSYCIGSVGVSLNRTWLCFGKEVRVD